MFITFHNGRNTLRATLAPARNYKVGYKIREMRLSRMLTRQQLADMAGVPREQVTLFEQNLPVALDYKRRILKELFTRKIMK